MISEKKDLEEGSSSCSNTNEGPRSVWFKIGGEGKGGLKGVEGRTLGMLIAEGTFSHVGKFDGALGACVHEPIAAHWVELCGGDNLCELLHVGGLDVDDVKALVLDVEIPQVDPEIITADEGFAITVDRDAVDVICVGVGVGTPRDGGHDGIMVCQTWKLEVVCRLEVGSGRQSSRSTTAGAEGVSRRQIVRQIVLGHHLQRLLEDLPQLDRLVVRRQQVM